MFFSLKAVFLFPAAFPLLFGLEITSDRPAIRTCPALGQCLMIYSNHEEERARPIYQTVQTS
jgi:hypothetical protein